MIDGPAPVVATTRCPLRPVSSLKVDCESRRGEA